MPKEGLILKNNN